MAVQAALLRAHPFVPFGFGGSPDGLGGAFGALDEGGCCFEDDEPGPPAAALLLPPPPGTEGGGEVREATRQLLSFMDSASSNIKLALDKPGKSKRKVNHRKYLQKQIKRCSGLVGPPSPGAADAPAKRALSGPSAPTAGTPAPAPAPAPGKAAPRRDASQAAAAASLQSRSLAALFDPLRHVPAGGTEPAGVPGAAPGPCGAGAGGAGGDAAGPAAGSAAPGCRKVPLRARNLPPSFFTEPSRGGPAGPGVSLGHLEKGAEAAELLELLGPDYGAGVLLAAEPPDAFPTPGAAVLRAPPELEPGLFEPTPPPAMAGSLLYPEPWSAPGCSPTQKRALTAPRGAATLNEPLRPVYPAAAAAADSPGGEDAPGLLASFASFFSDCALPPPPPPPPPHQVSYDYSSGYGRASYSGLWRPDDGSWEGAPGEEGAPRD